MTVSPKSLYERAQAVLPPAAGRATDLGVVRGEGAYLIAEDGRRYLDFASGVAVTNVGHNHPKVVAAAKVQMESLIHGGHNVVYYPSYVELAETLNELTGGGNKVYFSNSGAEANEGAVKLAKKVTKRPAVIAFKRAFHGRTLAAASLTRPAHCTARITKGCSRVCTMQSIRIRSAPAYRKTQRPNGASDSWRSCSSCKSTLRRWRR